MDLDPAPQRRPALLWLLVVLSAGVFALACLSGSLGPASECSTRAEIHLVPALPALLAAAALGFPVILAGSRLQRATLYLAIFALLGLYLIGLSQGIPMAIETEVACRL